MEQKCWSNGTMKISKSFWRTLDMPLISCEINLILTWSGNRFKIANPFNSQDAIFTITGTKLYVTVVTLSTELLQNYCNNWNLVLKEELTRISVNQKQQCSMKPMLRLPNWSKFSGSK